MPPKKTKDKSKTRKASKSPTKGRPKSNNSHKAGRKKSPSKKKKRSARTPTRAPVIDPFSPAARENALYISHNAEMFLTFRGFPYTGTKCKGGGKKGGKKKKRK